MVLLINRLLYCVEGYSHRDLGAGADGGLQPKSAAEFTSSLLHHRDTEMASAHCGPVGGIESLAIVANGEVQGIALVFQVDGDRRRMGMADRVRYSLLTDADEVMDTPGREQIGRASCRERV